MTQIFSQTIIAVVWDFDRTLIPGYMQQVVFDEYDVDGDVFWDEVNRMPEAYRKRGCADVTQEMMYLNHILDYVRNGRFDGLCNGKLKQLGQRLQFYPGLPDFLPHLKEIFAQDRYARHGIQLEHYVVSTGLKKLIEGSVLAAHVDGIWGCEFLDSDGAEPQLERIAYVLDDTTKTRAIFEINKGVNVLPGFKVNDAIEESKRRVPIAQMIYIADGPSDVPVFSVVNRFGGATYGVYNDEFPGSYDDNFNLSEQGRVRGFGPADYRTGSPTARWIEKTVCRIADEIVGVREHNLRANLGTAPTHSSDKVK